MKIAILLYGYSYATTYRTYDIRAEPHAIKVARKYFELSEQNFKKFFLDKGYDIYAHIWQDDYFRNSYIDIIKPKEYIISTQNEALSYFSNEIETNGSFWFYNAYVGPRIYMMNKLRELILDKDYDFVMLRRFDMIIKKQDFSFENLDIDKIHLIEAHLHDGRLYTENKFGIERVNDYQITMSYKNMINYLSITVKDVLNIINSKIFDTKEKHDHHCIICQRLKRMGLFEKINYFLEQPFDVVITKDEKGLALERSKCQI